MGNSARHTFYRWTFYVAIKIFSLTKCPADQKSCQTNPIFDFFQRPMSGRILRLETNIAYLALTGPQRRELSPFSNWRFCSHEQAKSECDWCRQCLLPANQVAFFSFRVNKFASWTTGFRMKCNACQPFYILN